MARFRSRRNKATELAFVRLLRRHRLIGWRRHHRLWLDLASGRNSDERVPRYCEPDFVFAKEKVAVMVDGCFWHGCPRHCRLPKTNSQYWVRKITQNKERDLIVAAVLKRTGWRVVRVWEHDVKSAARCVSRITSALEKSAWQPTPSTPNTASRSSYIATISGRARASASRTGTTAQLPPARSPS
jgi:DNA mismatch endonuclease (patch repair protein)